MYVCMIHSIKFTNDNICNNWWQSKVALACWSWKSKKEEEKFQAAGRGAYKPIRELKNKD